MIQYHFKKDDLDPLIEDVIRDKKGDPRDLTGHTVQIVTRKRNGIATATGAATVVDAVSGKVSYQLGGTETAFAGVIYDYYWKITETQSSDVSSYPAEGYHQFEVHGVL